MNRVIATAPPAPHFAKASYHSSLGTVGGTKTNEFSEKLQTAFDPPPPHPHPQLQIFHKSQFKALYKGPQSAIFFYIENGPSFPVGTFLKIHPFW